MAKDKASLRKIVISGMLGNGLEWYDYALYAQVAVLLSELYFPSENEATALLATFGVFAVGFIFRPLGAIMFGIIGDRYGRRSSLVIAILMMAIPTGCIGILPTYEQIGILAPLLLTVIRMFQGLSLGGEFSGSITYIVEHSPAMHRAKAGSTSIISLLIGFLLGSFVMLLFRESLSPEEFRSWGWRVPFLLGVVIGLVGMYIRTHCDESPAYEEAKREGHLSQTPVRTAFAEHWKPMLQAFCFYLTVTMPFYLSTVYLLSFSEKKLGLDSVDALTINTASMLTMLATTIFSGFLADRIGRKKVLVTAAAVMMLAIFPLFLWMDMRSYYAILSASLTFAVIVGFYISPIPAVLVELFPTSIRYTGMAISYNLAAAAFGGTAPLVCEWLIQQTGSYYSVPGYVVFCNLVSLAALIFFKDRWQEPLR